MDRATAERAIADSEWRELLPWLAALTEDERTELRRDYRSRWRAVARRLADSWQPRPRVVQIALAIALSESAEEASKNCTWGQQFAWTDNEVAFPSLLPLVLARGDKWALQFAELATATVLRAELARGAAEIAALTLPIYERSSRPLPEGALPVGWVHIVSSAEVATKHPAANWVPIRLLGPSGTLGVAYDLPTRLEDVLTATPRLMDVLVAALRTPDALGELATLKGADWELDATIRGLIGGGMLDREVIVDETLAALARADRPGAQRVMAALLRGADLSGADASSRVSIISHLMPSVHGSVTGVLLAAALESALDDEALLDIGSVIIARKEKAQKQLLMRSLTRGSLSPAAETLLTMAASDPDASFAAKARAALGQSAAPPAARDTLAATREIAVEGYRSYPFMPWTPDAAGLDAAHSEAATWVRITSNAKALDLAVRFAHRDARRLKEAVLAGSAPPSLWWWSGQPVLPSLHRWFSTGERRRAYEFSTTTMVRGADGGWAEGEVQVTQMTPEPHHEFTDRLVEETLPRLGSIAELLSTPSREDGSLSVDDLARRLKRAHGVGPYDLVQALLRLEPVPVAEAARFDGISAPMTREPKWRLGRRPAQLDAASVVADWIRAGGLPAKVITVDPDATRAGALHLPLPSQLAQLDGLSRLCDSGDVVPGHGTNRSTVSLRQPNDAAHYLGVVPYWGDAAAAYLGVSDSGESVYLPKALTILVSAPGGFDAGAHQLLARMQSHPRQDSRLLVVEALAVLARESRLDATLLRQSTLALLAAGELSLTRLADSWDNAIRIGLIRSIWPTVSGALSASLSMDRSPSGLADALRVVTAAIGGGAQVDTEELLPGVRLLAESKSASKSAQEARALVVALSGTRL